MRRWLPKDPGIGTGVVLIALATVIASGVAVAQGRDALVARGKALFMEKGCHGCHAIGSVGTPIGPDLSRVGVRHGEGDLVRWLGPPPAEEPTPGRRMPELAPVERDISPLLRHMPTPRLSGPEAEALAAYLASLR